VDADDYGFTADNSGSDFASEFMLGDFNSNDFTIDITGDELRFTQQPTDVEISTAISPSVTVAFTDANGNIDTDFTGSGCAIGLTTTGSFDASATTEVDAVNGVATFSNLVFDAAATDITITTTDPDSWGWTNITSDQFDVTAVSSDCASEDFDGAGNVGSYTTINWTGLNSVDWTATDARSDQDLDGNEAIMLRNGSLTNDVTISGGCGTIQFDYAQIYSGTSTLKVFVNSTQYGGDITVNSTSISHFSAVVNVSGNISVELENSGNRTLISNLEWTCYAATPCASPSAQPTSLDLNDNTTYNSIDGSFTASTGSPAAHGYLVVRSESSTLSANPQDATSYTAGESLGGGTVVYSGSSTSFTATGLSESTQYYFFVFAYQNTTCSGGPVYLTTSPLSGNETTTAGPDINLGALSSFGNVCVGTTAGPNSFALSGTNLTTADITIAALSGYTYSTTAGGTYTGTLTISGHGGGTYNTTIYVKFAPVAATTYNGNIAVSGAGVSSAENCAASGTGLALPTITGTTPGSVCNSGTVSLSATASAGTMDWFTASSGGTSLYTGANFTTPSISSTTSYWVETNDGSCTSTRTEVVASVITSPAITSSLTASGTTGNAFSYFITGSYSPTSYNATGLPAGLSINTSTGEISGTPTTIGVTDVTISATNACGTGSETLEITITSFSYIAGDYRTTADYVNFSWNNPAGTTNYWEYYDGSSWGPTPSDYAPENASSTPGRIIVDHVGINGGGNTTNKYNSIVIREGGQLILTDIDIPPVSSEFINSGEEIEVLSGGELLIQGDIDLPSDGSLIVRNGGILTIDHDNMDNVHPIWDGVENFEVGSTVKILDWDFGASATVASLVNFVNDIANNNEGYKFGYLIYDVNTGTEDWAVVGGSVGVINLVYNDFTIDNAGSGYIGGITNRTGTNGYVVNGDLIVNSGNFNFSATYNTDDFEHQATINGNFEFNSSDNLVLHRNGYNTPGSMTKTTGSFVEFKGNLLVNSSATFTNELASDNTRMFMVINGSGTEVDPQLLDIGVTTGMTGIDTYINNNTFVKLASNDWIFNGISGLTTGITLETGSSLHFGWADDGTTPLKITMPGSAVGTNTITTETGTTLFMTHSQGLDDGTNLSYGNVQQFAQANRSFNQTASFWYVGKANQVTGSGITTASTNKLIGLNMGTSTNECTLSDDITTSGKLVLMNGVLKTTSSELLSLEDNATVHTDADGTNGEPGSANSWVDGPMKKIGNDAFIFPLGETIWAPIGISAPSNATDEFTGEYFHEAYTDIINMEASLESVSDIDYWDITRNNGSSLPTVTAYWKDNRHGFTDVADVVVAHYVGGLWKDKGHTNGTGTVSAGSVDNATAFSSFSPITLGIFDDVMLPVELLSFDARFEDEVVVVDWVTGSETNNECFTVERSKNGEDFDIVTNVAGAGNSSFTINYEITDYSPFSGNSYYRLKQTDFDKTTSYSDVVAVTKPLDNQLSEINVWSEESFVYITFENVVMGNDGFLVEIHDMLGRNIYENSYQADLERVCIDLGSKMNSNAVYVITVISDGLYVTKKLVW
jgi:hypothetical protein